MDDGNSLTRRAPKKHASDPHAPRRNFGFSSFGMGARDKNIVERHRSDTLAGLIAIDEGFYGFISVAHVFRGGLRHPDGTPVLSKFPCYWLGGAHLKTPRFPGNQQWRDLIRGHGGIWHHRSGHYFVPVRAEGIEAIHEWLVPFLTNAIEERQAQLHRRVHALRQRAIAERNDTEDEGQLRLTVV